ncbi:hypothetical protein AMQ84_27185 [Paenibacillus riograndensis]|uniref:Uncharacterized protein n=1 Tax=Paenibacillus riograndensis TaxID=483937 RepID=A0A132TJU6_9BACL|nr:hypothetical protein [Paenibacillus riograndensis]KWX71609.1 hypothetical protein AMQ84_27185 [Paenibacillus riograndensis]
METYLHINNGGVMFYAGPDQTTGELCVRVRAHHFNMTTNLIELWVDAKSLREIGESFIAAAEAGTPEGIITASSPDKNAERLITAQIVGGNED